MVLREVGERPRFEFEIRDHLDLGIANGWIEMEKASEASGSRFAYLLGDLVLVGAGPGAPRDRAGRRRGVRSGGPAGAGSRGPAIRHRLLPRRARDDLRGPPRRAVPGRDLGGLAGGAPRGRDPGRRRPAAPLRGALHLLPARGRSRRQGHARDLPRPPVRQGRDVLVRQPGGVGRRARAPAGDSGANPPGARDPLPGGGHRRRRPRGRGGAQVRLRGLDSRARSATAR